MRNGLSKIQFITNASDALTTIAQIRTVLDGGCRWVQIRMKDADEAEVRRAVLEAVPVVNGYGAALIVDDRVALAARYGVDGVHLGKDDMNPTEARQILGPKKIIGLTVNSLETVEDAIAAPVDYYGVGPLRFTKTKQRLAPVLGLTGVSEIVRRLKAAHPERAIVVIGGVDTDDIADIVATGADGIAVSSALIGPDSTYHTRQMLDIFDKLSI